MKMWIGKLVIMAVLAGLLVVLEWLRVHAGDAFTLVHYDGQAHKIFVYGFPFRIVEGNMLMDLVTPSGQRVWAMVGNWASFFVAGLLLLVVGKKLCHGSANGKA